MTILLRTPTEEEQAMLDFATSKDINYQRGIDYFSACFKEEAARPDANDDHLLHFNRTIVFVLNEAYEYWETKTGGQR